MADFRVTGTGKDRDGDITKLCGAWGKVSKAQAIREIETGENTYYVQIGTRRTDVRVVNGVTGEYLRTDADRASSNSLDNLPDC